MDACLRLDDLDVWTIVDVCFCLKSFFQVVPAHDGGWHFIFDIRMTSD